ncbi:hypothetical protein B0H19DRAFT_660306 [Mycena capillaripes]|nr:hypothetical protein B0H19DRAFT_660306 [Mycena capillaripes]
MMELESCDSKLEGENNTVSQQSTFQYTDQTKKLADETLLAILRFALPPSWRMDYGTALPPFPRTIWSVDYHTKLVLIAVSKTWYRVGLEFLYENVMLQSIGTLAAFMQAVETRAELGALVRRLEICYVVPSGYQLFHAAEAKKIFELCPRITHFTFNPKVLPHAAPPLFPLPGLGQAIANLDIGDFVQYSSILPALQRLCRTLQSLSITLPSKYDDGQTTLDFAHLENLRLALAMDSQVPGARWVIPELRQICFRPSWLGKPTAPLYHTAACALLAAYGSTVKVLKILPVGRGSPSLQQLLDRCPALQHLATGDWCLDAPLRHETLRYLDALRDSYTPVDSKEEKFERLRDMFPALRACRFVDGCHDILLDPPPTESTLSVVEQAVDYGFPESCWLPGMLLSEECSADDCSDDSDYYWEWEYDSDGSVLDSGGSGGSGGFVLDSSTDGFDSTESDTGGSVLVQDSDTETSESDSPAHLLDVEDLDWEADREDALEIFRRTLSDIL